MSRTWKNRQPKRYRRGYDWIDSSYTRKTERQRIKRINCPSGGAYKKVIDRLDRYCGL